MLFSLEVLLLDKCTLTDSKITCAISNIVQNM